MTTKSEILERYLKAILEVLPEHIDQYSLKEQQLIQEILEILQDSGDIRIHTERQKLSEKFQKYREKYYKTQEYLELPFLWFTVDFFSTANFDLSTANMETTSFHNYLVRQLKGNSQTEGIFQLLKKNVSLEDQRWEKVQYLSQKTSPLTKEEFEVISSLYSLLHTYGIFTLDSRQIRTTIMEKVKSQRLIRNLRRFFSLLNLRWRLRYFSPMFGLNNLFFHIQLEETSSLFDVIDFRDKRNTTLCSSYLYRVKKQETGDQTDRFIGVLVIPEHQTEHIHHYLQSCERDNQIRIYELEQLENIRTSTSLRLYNPEEGWRSLAKTELKRLNTLLKKPNTNLLNDNVDHRSESQLYKTQLFNREWHYLRHPQLSEKLIDLYCKPRKVFYKNLPLDKKNPDYSIREQNLLKWLWDNNLVQITLEITRLVFDFSQDFFWIHFPQLSSQQLSEVIKYLPFAQIYFLNDCVNVLTPLNENLVHQFTKLGLTQEPVIYCHNPIKLLPELYDYDQNQWKAPRLLTA